MMIKKNWKARPKSLVDQKPGESFEPFFFEDDDFWAAEAHYIGGRLDPAKFLDYDYTYEQFVQEEFSAALLGGPGSPRENEELQRYFEQEWPEKAKLAKRIFNDKIHDASKEGDYAVYFYYINDEELEEQVGMVAVNTVNKSEGPEYLGWHKWLNQEYHDWGHAQYPNFDAFSQVMRAEHKAVVEKI